ncbi:MAG: winged helix-turn-helix transcriptional regulator [Candidatus Binatia bacterium]
MNKKKVGCPAEVALNAIAGRWKLVILRELCAGTTRFGAMRRALSGISEKMLAQDLRELERDGLVSRKIYPQIPPKVEYFLTASGKDLKPILDALDEWGAKRLARDKQVENKTSSGAS